MKPPIFSVEWAPNAGLVGILMDLRPSASHFLLPDLPAVFSEQDCDDFQRYITNPRHRIHTIATCRHDNYKSLLKTAKNVQQESKILLVRGNGKSKHTMTTVQAVNILQNEIDNELWGVANPNDADSIRSVHSKVEAGIKGIITQPLLASNSHATLRSYKNEMNADLTVLAGMAFPNRARSLQFWATLLEQEECLKNDPLFQSHLAFFSQPYYQSIAWIGREFHELLMMTTMADDAGIVDTSPTIDGIHCMPLKNTEDLITIFSSLNANIPQSDTQ
jgi:hypothetical protein